MNPMAQVKERKNKEAPMSVESSPTTLSSVAVRPSDRPSASADVLAGKCALTRRHSN